MSRHSLCSVVLFASLVVSANQAQAATLVSHWKFDEGTGQAAQDSFGTNNGTLGANGSVGSDDPVWAGAGKIGTNSLNFDGTDDFVDFASPATLNVTNVTMAAWVNLDTTKTQAIFDKSSSGASGSGLHLRVGQTGADNRVRSFVGNVSGGFADTGVSDTVALGNWTHVAMTSTGTNIKIYLNGSLKVTTPISSGIVNNSSPFRIGGSSVLGLSYSLDGRIDDAGFWSDVLNDAQVNAVYTLGNNGSLVYNVSQAQQLFNLYTAGSGSVDINGEHWVNTTGLSGGLGNVVQNGSNFFLQLNANGTGLMAIAVPEPASGMLLGLFTAGLYIVRRRQTRA